MRFALCTKLLAFAFSLKPSAPLAFCAFALFPLTHQKDKSSFTDIWEVSFTCKGGCNVYPVESLPCEMPFSISLALYAPCTMRHACYPAGAQSFFKQVSHKAPSTHNEGGAFLFCLPHEAGP